jgi:hypothetical protein
MADLHKDSRIEDASDLIRRIHPYKKVPADVRAGLIHDRLMEAFDGICQKHRGEGQAIFTAKQTAAIKDVIFHVVYILDTRNAPATGFFRRSLHEFRTAGLASKITSIVGILTIIGAIGTAGTWAWNSFVVPAPSKATEQLTEPAEAEGTTSLSKSDPLPPP